MYRFSKELNPGICIDPDLNNWEQNNNKNKTTNKQTNKQKTTKNSRYGFTPTLQISALTLNYNIIDTNNLKQLKFIIDAENN